MDVKKIATWIPVTDEMLDTTPPTPEQEAWSRQYEADRRAELAARAEALANLTPAEQAAAAALYADDIVEVGYEGIGGFYAGQAEETIVALRRAGFTIVGPDDDEDDPGRPWSEVIASARASVKGEVGELTGPPILGTADTVNSGRARPA